MILDPQWLPAWLTVVAAMAMTTALVAAIRAAPWRRLLAVAAPQHLVLGSTLGLVLLWLGIVELTEGVRVHFLAMTFVTMLVGWPLALIAGSVALAAQFLLLDLPLPALPIAWLLSVAVPATATRALLRALRRRAPRHLFVYLLGGGFAGGILASLATTATALTVLVLAGRWSLVAGAVDEAPVLLLMLFPEGFLNGMLVTAFTVFHPELMKTFDAEHYLD